MKNTIKYYLIAIFIISLAILGTCGMLTVDEKGSHMLFGKETQTIQLNAEDIGAELRKIF
ncbi:MAG: hypothetical protein IJ261_01685 [Clostridia bacterium]|nr:hypothetical protein [Clostridia bacterium]